MPEYCRNTVTMKRFLLYAPEMMKTEQEVWRQAGFDFVTEEEVAADAGLGVDVLLRDNIRPYPNLSETQDLWSLIEQLRPKVFILKCETPLMIPSLQLTYSVQEYIGEIYGWFLGTKLEAPLSDDMGALLSEQATAAFAESLYYYLLRDVFRETAEWCGHMSSVVGRM